jgi:hypothetical protein
MDAKGLKFLMLRRKSHSLSLVPQHRPAGSLTAETTIGDPSVSDTVELIHADAGGGSNPSA